MNLIKVTNNNIKAHEEKMYFGVNYLNYFDTDYHYIYFVKNLKKSKKGELIIQ